MREKIVSIIFNPGRGTLEQRSVNRREGQPLDSFPTPKLRGYQFIGWYVSDGKNAPEISLEETKDLPDGTILYAKYKKKQPQPAESQTRTPDGKRKVSLMRRQKIAIFVLIGLVALLIAAYFVVQYIVSIYVFTDTDGTEYYLKKNDEKLYCLYDKDGNLCPANDDGYYITAADSQVSVDPETGSAELYAVVDTEGSEVVGYSSRIMLYKQLTYDATSSTATADCSRIIRTIDVTNESGNYGFSRAILMSDSQQGYYVSYVGGKYVLCDDAYTPVTTDSDGSVTTPDGIKITVDGDTGHYTAVASDNVFAISYNTSFTDGEKTITKLNISIKYNGQTYYIMPTYATGSGTSFTLYTYSDGTFKPVNPNATDGNGTYGYQLTGATITVDTSYGGYSIVDSATNKAFAVGSAVGDMVLTESQDTPYNIELFASLSSACGYTISTDKLALTAPIDYAEYGLCDLVRQDGEGNDYNYSPAKFTVTTVAGDSYTVLVGDTTVSEGGYYVKFEGREAVYILSSTGISTTVVMPVETLVTPTLVYQMSLTTYFNVKDFEFLKDVDYKAIYDKLTGEGKSDSTDITTEEWQKLVSDNSTLVCKFTYIPLEERQYSINSSYAYEVQNEYMKGYTANDDNIMSMLQSIYSLTYVGVKKLHPTVSENADIEDDFDRYNLAKPAYILKYQFPVESGGETVYVDNYVEISERNVSGTYYAYSPYYDMIVEIDESQLGFLTWSDTDWYKSTIFDVNIAHVSELIVESPEQNVKNVFDLDNSRTSQSAYYAVSVSSFDMTLENGSKITYSSVKVGDKYVLISDSPSNPPIEIKSMNYLVAADESGMTAYKAPTNERPEIILTETAEDEDTGITTYYYYYVNKDSGSYIMAVMAGSAYSDGTTVPDSTYINNAVAAYTTEYFISDAKEIYFLGKNSPSASQLDGVSGAWHTGSVYYTKDSAYILVDNATGAWCKLSGLTQALYSFDDTDTVADISGIYHTGTKYKLANGAYYLVDSKTGEIGQVYSTDIRSTNLVVYANGSIIDYSIPTVSSTGREETRTAVTNFRKFFTALLYATIEGQTEMTEEQMNEYKSKPDSECQLILTLLAEDLDGNTKNLRYRFYRMPGGGSYMTIESLDSTDLSQSSPQNGYGSFYILSSFVDKLIADSQRVINGELVTDTSKY